MLDLSIIIVNWNVRDLLRKALASLTENPAKKYSTEVIVVDNASQDGSNALVEKEFPKVTLVKSEKNLGFAAGNNLGLKLAQGRNILFLNPDTEMHPGTLDFIIKALDDNKSLGALGIKLLNSNGTLQLSCKSFPDVDTILWNALSLDVLFPKSQIFGKYNMTWFKHDHELDVDQPMGAALAVKKSVLDQVGIFDERYFMYFDEVDLCYRIKQAGWNIRFYPQVQVTHHWGKSTSQALFNMNKQWYVSFAKYLQKNRQYPLPLVWILLTSLVWLKLLIWVSIIILMVIILGGLF